MLAGLTVIFNGAERTFAELESGASATDLVGALGFREDRVALEKNGEIVPRANWPATSIAEGDRIEVVHFVGGGCRSDAGVAER